MGGRTFVQLIGSRLTGVGKDFMDIQNIVSVLAEVPGVTAIALGGSQSRKEADENSDYDIGIYYKNKDLDLITLADCLKKLDDSHRDNLLNPPGAWGPWINGGGWLTVDGTPVDILLRETGRVEAVLNDCLSGRITIDYQCGHPFGFVNTIYAAETHYCMPLWQDDASALDRLKTLLYSEGEYPPRMREAVMAKFLWEAWFSLECGRKAARKGDINYACGSVFRTVCSWAEVLFALNNVYLMNEKGALPGIRALSRKPADMEARIKSSYKLIMDGCADEAWQVLDELHCEIGGLPGDMKPVITEIR